MYFFLQASLQAMQQNNNVPVKSTYVYIASMQMQYCKHMIQQNYLLLWSTALQESDAKNY